MNPDLSQAAAHIRYDLRIGRAMLAIFDTPYGAAVLEYHAPQGIRGNGDYRSERPRLVLWVSGSPRRILADVDLTAEDRATLELELGAVVARGSEVAGDEKPLFDLLLRMVRDHHLELNRRPQAARVGDRVTSTGVATLDAWASCLTLGDLQAAILESMRSEQARAA